MCNITSYTDDATIENISLSENLHRTNLTQKDKCNQFYKYYILNNKNITKLAYTTSLTENTLFNYIKLKEGLNDDLFNKLDLKGEDKLTMETAINLCKYVPKDKQIDVLLYISKIQSASGKKEILKQYSINPEIDLAIIVDEYEINNLEKINIVENIPWLPDSKGDMRKIPKELFKNINELIDFYEFKSNK